MEFARTLVGRRKEKGAKIQIDKIILEVENFEAKFKEIDRKMHHIRTRDSALEAHTFSSTVLALFSGSGAGAFRDGPFETGRAPIL